MRIETTTLHNKEFRTHVNTDAPTIRQNDQKPWTQEVLGWPEFKAFADRLGIELEDPNADLTIKLAVELIEITPPQSGPVTTGYDAWRWPEFKAFAKRLGVEWSAPVVSLTIELMVNSPVRINQCFYGRDMTDHNE